MKNNKYTVRNAKDIPVALRSLPDNELPIFIGKQPVTVRPMVNCPHCHGVGATFEPSFQFCTCQAGDEAREAMEAQQIEEAG